MHKYTHTHTCLPFMGDLWRMRVSSSNRSLDEERARGMSGGAGGWGADWGGPEGSSALVDEEEPSPSSRVMSGLPQ